MRTEAWKMQRSLSGESMTFVRKHPAAAQSVTAIVNRTPRPPKDERMKLKFQQQNMSCIEVLKSEVTSAPLSGEHFRDSENKKHMIEIPQNDDILWICWCSVFP